MPTIALLLGMPIPYSSIGQIIPELFSTAASGRVNEGTKLQHNNIRDSSPLLTAFRMNSIQVGIVLIMPNNVHFIIGLVYE